MAQNLGSVIDRYDVILEFAVGLAIFVTAGGVYTCADTRGVAKIPASDVEFIRSAEDALAFRIFGNYCGACLTSLVNFPMR